MSFISKRGDPISPNRALSEEDSQAFLAAIVESSEDAIVSKNLDGIIQSWNKAAERMFGYTAEEIIGQPVLRLIPPELHYEEPQILRRISAGERIEHHETRRRRKDGTLFDVALSISPIRDQYGTIIGASKIARDISERKKLDDYRFRLAAIVDSSDDAIISKDLDGIITSWNSAASSLFGYSPEEMVGHSILLVIPPELHHEEATIMEKIRAGERVEHFETVRIRKGGERVPVWLTISPVLDMNGTVIGASKIARDISERKRTEQALLESEKLAATGRMAATIAHEINNPLEAITNLAYLLTLNQNLDDDARKYSQMLLSEISRISHITKQTLSFYRDTGRPLDFDLAELLDSVIDSQRSRIASRDIQIHRGYTKEVIVTGFPSELRQVFSNLLLNAVDAAGRKGEIQIRIRSIRPHSQGKPTAAMVTIADNGSGIPLAIRSRLFEPFFTTKSSSGTGLGLWVSSGIVKKHGGRILLHSRTSPERSGTVFAVVLPGREATADSDSESSRFVHSDAAQTGS